MILRIIFIILVVVFHEKIFYFLRKNKLDTPDNIRKTLTKKTGKFVNSIVNNDFKGSLEIIKKVDKNTYKKCIKILRNIDKIKRDLKNNKTIDFKNEYLNIKLYRKEMLNMLASMIVNHGFFREHPKIMKITEQYLKDILEEVLDIAQRKKYDVNWFEDFLDDVEPNDTSSSGYTPNYSLF
mgnify:FL=1